MFKPLIILSLFANAAFSAPSQYSCSNVGGVEEWTIYVDLTAKQAGFFDNDTTVTVPLTSVRSLESLPPQMLYVFEGKDNRGGNRIRISFNQTRLTGSVTFIDRRGNETTKRAEDGCEVDNFNR